MVILHIATLGSKVSNARLSK